MQEGTHNRETQDEARCRVMEEVQAESARVHKAAEEERKEIEAKRNRWINRLFGRMAI